MATIAMLLLCSVMVGAGAPPGHAKSVRRAAIHTASEPAQRTLASEAITELPPFFKGYDFVAFVDSTLHSFSARGPYESTQEYQDRMAAISVADNTYPVALSLPPTYSYDADNEELMVKLPHLGTSLMVSITGTRKEARRINIYGGPLKKSSTTAKMLALTVDPSDGLGLFYAQDEVEEPALLIGPTAAKAIAENADRALVLWSPVRDPNGSIAFEESYTGTIPEQVPEEYRVAGYNIAVTGVRATIREVWLFNSATGEVLAKCYFWPEPNSDFILPRAADADDGVVHVTSMHRVLPEVAEGKARDISVEMRVEKGEAVHPDSVANNEGGVSLSPDVCGAVKQWRLGARSGFFYDSAAGGERAYLEAHVPVYTLNWRLRLMNRFVEPTDDIR